jgi:hypothetical protein
VYLRESSRRNKDGSKVTYLQLAHNERHPVTGSPVAKVIHNFGRKDKVDKEALARLVSSISRIRSHVQLCWLSLLLVRVIENATGDTWRNVRHELDRMHLVTMETAEGRVAQRTATTPGQAEILANLDIAEPGRYLDFELPTPSS